MPLFKSHPAPAPEPEPVVDNTARKGSMFSRRRSTSPVPQPANDPVNNSPARRGFFGRSGRGSLDNGDPNVREDNRIARNGSVMSGGDSVRSGRSGPGFFGRTTNNDVHNDPTILAAREKVSSAEQAEADADRALLQARAMVKEARDHVRFLEREAAAEYVPFVPPVYGRADQWQLFQGEARATEAGYEQRRQQERFWPRETWHVKSPQTWMTYTHIPRNDAMTLTTTVFSRFVLRPVLYPNSK